MKHKFKYVMGADLLEAFEQNKLAAIAHQCNCFHTMGAGIARVIATKYEDARLADLKTPHGDRGKLGTFSLAQTKYGGIYNIYSQYSFGGNATEPIMVVRGILAVLNHLGTDKELLPLGLPYRFGAGLGGGDWEEVAASIDQAIEISGTSRPVQVFVLPEFVEEIK